MTPRALMSLLAIAIAAVGCATADVIPMGTDTYLISQTSAGGVFKSMSSLKTEVIKRANAFADSKGKVAIPIAAKESPAYPGHMPNFEYQFRLVNKDDPRASGGGLIPRADVIIENNVEAPPIQMPSERAKKPDLYSELLKLDDLKKKGLISDAEFESQKAKLLSAQ